MKKKYNVKMWSKWLEELWDASEDFDSYFKTTPTCLRANSFTISQFEFITAISPIGNEIKNAESGKLASEHKNPQLKELELKGFCILRFEVDNAISDKSFWLEFTLEEIKRSIAKEQEVVEPSNADTDKIIQHIAH